MSFGELGTLALVIYLVALTTIAEIARRARVDSSPSDHFLAGRSLGTMVLFLTLYATAYSGNSLLGGRFSLCASLIGAIIILAQIGVTEMNVHVFVSLGLLGLSILISLTGQDHMVDSLLKGKSIYSIAKLMKVLRVTSLLCLGMGAGYFSANIF